MATRAMRKKVEVKEEVEVEQVELRTLHAFPLFLSPQRLRVKVPLRHSRPRMYRQDTRAEEA